MNLHPKEIACIIHGLRAGWSPEAIARKNSYRLADIQRIARAGEKYQTQLRKLAAALGCNTNPAEIVPRLVAIRDHKEPDDAPQVYFAMKRRQPCKTSHASPSTSSTRGSYASKRCKI